MENNICITESDYVKLCDLVKAEKLKHSTEVANLTFLGAEIKRAQRVRDEDATTEFVAMNSVIEIIDLDTKREMKVKLAYPHEADFRKGSISVLSLFGTALLGYKTGSIVSYQAPKGIKKVKIKKIYQPEKVV